MLDFFNRFFKPAPPSGATAKERLRLVLLSDHLSLAPDVVESLKRDLLAVISRYVEIDQAHADVTFEHRQNEVAMLANIPITGIRDRQRSEPPARPPAPVAVSVTERAPEPVLGASEAHAAVDDTADVVSASESVPEGGPEKPIVTPAGTTSRRRRRRKSAAAKRAAQQTMQLNQPAQA